MRIELRQIGVRDEAKMMGGIGSCGRALCCHSWLADFEPVSIKMAKVQNLSLNPTKISGICGRLMCCLKYENDIYMQLRRGMPDVGERIKTPDGYGKVVDTNLLENKIKVRLFVEEKTDRAEGVEKHGRGRGRNRRGRNEQNAQEAEAVQQPAVVEEKLSSDIYTYKKEDIRRTERRRERSGERSLFEGVDAATRKEIEQLIKD